MARWLAPTGLAAALLAGTLAACAPTDSPPVQLCKFALARAVKDPPADPGSLLSQLPGSAEVELYFQHQGNATTAVCDIRVTDFAVRLRAMTIGGSPVPPATMAEIRANWASREDAGKLYQL